MGATIEKAATGIQGLDEITGGGLPRGRPTLVCGGAGCGKTLLAMEFLVRGAAEFNEPGVFVSFEENAAELTQNVRSLGFDLDALKRKKKLSIDFVRVERSEIEETGDYDLEGLFVRLGYAIDSIGAKRVVLDTIETLFSGLSNGAILRAELRRLFRWLKDRGVTAVITGERGDGALTRQGLEEYVSDCVILLDHRVIHEVSTRRLRVVKYRGTTHGTNEYPFLIDEQGISVLPITSLGLGHKASTERISSGIPALDTMLGGRGYYRGSTILLSGTAGTGKTSMSASFVNAACARGERCLYFAFEESQEQVIRNMRSIGINLAPWVKKGLLQFHANRSTLYGMEMHLAQFHRAVQEFRPQVVVVDPMGSLMQAGTNLDVTTALSRLIDFLKVQEITAMMTHLTSRGESLEGTDLNVSSVVDSWLLLRMIESTGERNRALYVLKSRGMAHSNQIREFQLTDCGVNLVDVYVGPDGVLTGSARLAQEARDRAVAIAAEQTKADAEQALERKKEILEAQVAGLRMEFEIEQEKVLRLASEEEMKSETVRTNRTQMAARRQSNGGSVRAERGASKETGTL
ncbi:MAG: circadian clock protein KaiC [Phycisphaerales bacterium]